DRVAVLPRGERRHGQRVAVVLFGLGEPRQQLLERDVSGGGLQVGEERVLFDERGGAGVGGAGQLVGHEVVAGEVVEDAVDAVDVVVGEQPSGGDGEDV